MRSKGYKTINDNTESCIGDLSVPLTLFACLQGSRQSCYQAMLR